MTALDDARRHFADATAAANSFGSLSQAADLSLAQTAALISIAETLKQLAVVEFTPTPKESL